MLPACERPSWKVLIFFHDDGAVDLLDQIEVNEDGGALPLRILRLCLVIGEAPGLLPLRPAADDPRLAMKADAAGTIRVLLARRVSVVDRHERIFRDPPGRAAVAALPVAKHVVGKHRDAALGA